MAANRLTTTLVVIAIVATLLAVAESASNTTQCDGGKKGHCKFICCNISNTQFGCCPREGGVCCAKGDFCCPPRYECSVTNGTHNATRCLLKKRNATDTLSRHKRSIMVRPIRVDYVGVNAPNRNVLVAELVQEPKARSPLCPDGAHKCPSNQTCCVVSGEDACCPLEDAVCCKNSMYCCPHGYTCDVEQKTCSKPPSFILLHARKMKPLIKSSVETSLPQLKIGEIVVDSIRTGITCPDNGTCTSNQTCCLSKTGKYGCCPSPDAVCCSDHVHCCPHGFKCDVATGQCAKEIDQTSPIEIEKIFDIPCGTSGTTSCNTNATCCKLKNGSYGCCPLADAVCCADHTHCCPHGYRCSDKPGECVKGYVDFFDRRPNVDSDSDTIRCDDGTVCVSETTCCKTPNGTYGCCPAENAVCCADLIHCCPHGTTCDLAGGKCREATSLVAVPLMRKVDAMEIGNVVCPDQSLCPNGDTCCEVGSGVFGCCPSPNAVCCADGKHCCKTGFTCDSSNNTCSKETKEPMIQYHHSVSDDICPGGTEECKGDNVTCCRTSTGFGCCPLKNAVCCSDLVHCCPSGLTCDTSTGKCNSQSGVTTERVEISKIATSDVDDVACPDGSSCSTNDTCCKTASGYGCCPLPSAVCCADMKHCCPNGYACDTSTGKCNLGTTERVEISKIATSDVDNVACPDGSSCPTNDTCCKTATGYGCCPLPFAVCCADMKHCCPNDYACESGGKCVDARNNDELESTSIVSTIERKIECPDGGHCGGDSTCCRKSSESNVYGCCPFSDGVCCLNDRCCPSNTRCNSETRTCDHVDPSIESPSPAADLIPELEKTLAMIRCPDKGYCTDNETCCERSGEESYGCCPYPLAVCCKDGVHCCKKGDTCADNSTRCIAENDSSNEASRIDALVLDVQSTCPDGHNCTSAQTCCQTTTGHYGCCPAAKATCCRDNIHCCKAGYKCSSTSDNCIQEEDASVAPPLLLTSSVVHCTDGNVCPDTSTCCLSPDGTSGCCPIANATCCADGVHCCPSTETCSAMGLCESSVATDVVVRRPAKTNLTSSIVCPDETTLCDDDSTCCPLTPDGAEYGCCPILNAVCCSDGLHCCPESFTCSEKGDCSKIDSDGEVAAGVLSGRKRERDDIL